MAVEGGTPEVAHTGNSSLGNLQWRSSPRYFRLLVGRPWVVMLVVLAVVGVLIGVAFSQYPPSYLAACLQVPYTGFVVRGTSRAGRHLAINKLDVAYTNGDINFFPNLSLLFQGQAQSRASPFDPHRISGPIRNRASRRKAKAKARHLARKSRLATRVPDLGSRHWPQQWSTEGTHLFSKEMRDEAAQKAIEEYLSDDSDASLALDAVISAYTVTKCGGRMLCPWETYNDAEDDENLPPGRSLIDPESEISSLSLPSSICAYGTIDKTKQGRFVVGAVDDKPPDTFNAESLKAICQLDNQYIAPYLKSSCPSYTVGYYASLYANKSSCLQIEEADVTYFRQVLLQCYPFYLDGSLKETCSVFRCRDVPDICTHYDAIFKVFFYLADEEFQPASNTSGLGVLRYSMIFLPDEYPDEELQQFYADVCSDCDEHPLSNDDVKIVAMNILQDLRMFGIYLVADISWLVLAIVLVVAVMLMYLRSIVLVLATVINIGFSFCLAYFLYQIAFTFNFFTFINFLGFLILIGIASDDVFIFKDAFDESLRRFDVMHAARVAKDMEKKKILAEAAGDNGDKGSIFARRDIDILRPTLPGYEDAIQQTLGVHPVSLDISPASPAQPRRDVNNDLDLSDVTDSEDCGKDHSGKNPEKSGEILTNSDNASPLDGAWHEPATLRIRIHSRISSQDSKTLYLGPQEQNPPPGTERDGISGDGDIQMRSGSTTPGLESPAPTADHSRPYNIDVHPSQSIQKHLHRRTLSGLSRCVRTSDTSDIGLTSADELSRPREEQDSREGESGEPADGVTETQAQGTSSELGQPEVTYEDDPALAENRLVTAMSEAYSHAAMSIMVTSLTTGTALVANMSSKVIAIRMFGIYTMSLILSNFALMLTWVPAFVVVVERINQRQKARRRRRGQKEAAREGGPTARWRRSQAAARCGSDLLRVIRAVSDYSFNVIIAGLISRGWHVMLAILLCLGVGGIYTTFVNPKLGLPHGSYTQLLRSDHPFELYQSTYIYMFQFETPGEASQNMTAVFVWGVDSTDNSRQIDPFDNGTLIFLPFDLYNASSQEWFQQFCLDLRNNANFSAKEMRHIACSMDAYSRWMQLPCLDDPTLDFTTRPCCEQPFPMDPDAFMTCLPYLVLLESLVHPNNQTLGYPVFDTNNTVVAFIVPAILSQPVSEDYAVMDVLYNDLSAFFHEEMGDIPPGLEGGWFWGYFYVYILQYQLARGTYSSLIISIVVAFVLLLLTTLNFLVAFYAIIAICLSIFVLLGSLALMGWQLNIIQAAVVTLSVGLSIDFTIHYGVAYLNSRATTSRKRATECIRSVGPAVVMAALTTFLAGTALMPCETIAFIELGTFLMLTIVISWAYGTFFFLPLCRIAGPTHGCFCKAPDPDSGRHGKLDIAAIETVMAEQVTCEQGIGPLRVVKLDDLTTSSQQKDKYYLSPGIQSDQMSDQTSNQTESTTFSASACTSPRATENNDHNDITGYKLSTPDGLDSRQVKE